MPRSRFWPEWVWALIRPGMATMSSASITRADPGRSLGPISVIVPPSVLMSATCSGPSASRIVAPRTRSSEVLTGWRLLTGS